MQDLKDKIMLKIKQITKKIVAVLTVKLLPLIGIFCIIMVLFGAIIYFIKDLDGSYKDGDKKNTGYTVKSLVLDDEELSNATSSDEGYRLNIDLDEKVDEIIKQLEENDGQLNKYLSKEHRKEYLKTFIKAELVTQYPDLRDEKHIGTETKSNEFQGVIKVKRKNKEGEEKTLTYLDYETFEGYVTGGNYDSIKNRFTLDSSGNLVVAGWTSTNTTVSNTAPGVEVTEENSYNVVERNINYKALLEKYTMPFDFLWALLVMTEDEDLVYDIAQLALNSDITITAFDNYTEITTEETTNYEQEQKRQIWVSITKKSEKNNDMTIQQEGDTDTLTKGPEKVNCSYQTVKTTVNKDNSVTLDVEYADTWIAKYTNEYTKNQLENSSENTENVEDGEWINITDGYISVAQAEADSTFQDMKQQIINEKGGTDAKITSAYLLDRIRPCEIMTDTSTISTTYQMGTAKVEEKTDKKSEEPNFVTLLNKYKKARGAIISAPEWLFGMLEKSEKTADMIDLVKYLLYKATDNDFGVTEFDFNVFKLNKINAVGREGVLSVTSSPITKEQFVECVQSYSAALSKGTKTAPFRENAEVIYDICVNNNINPVLCAAQAWTEQNWIYPNTSPYNYWGIAVYNGQNYGKSFSSVENGVQGYCNQLNSQMSGSLYSLYQARAAEFATVNDKFKGDMSNMYDVFSAYAYIGDGHTLAEEAEYVVNYVDLLGKCAVQIFGEDVLGAGSGVTTQEEADALTEKFNQMLNTVVHQQAGKGRVGPYQLGPYEKWWSYPYSGLTPFQCTWWANGRACMYLEQYGTKYTKYPTQIGNGGEYYNENLKGGWFNYGTTPKVNSIISWSDSGCGHVAYVEGVTDDGIWISDAGTGVAWRGVRKITLSYAASSNGYIYLDEPL